MPETRPKDVYVMRLTDFFITYDQIYQLVQEQGLILRTQITTGGVVCKK
jgi:hypothetical protein